MRSARLIVTLVLAVTAACSSTPESKDQMVVTFSSPAEEDAIPIEDKFESKQKALEKLGEPARTKALAPSGTSSCTERWFYPVKANIAGLGAIDLLTYVDFDAHGKGCVQSRP